MSLLSGPRRFAFFLITLFGPVLMQSQAQSITTTNLNASQVTLNLTSLTTGTGYFTLLKSGATCGTPAQTKAGKDSSGASAIHGSLALVANTASLYTVRNLLQSTAYTVCFSPDGTSLLSSPLTTTAAVNLTNAAWTTVGVAGFSGEILNASLAFAPDGTPYVAYEDFDNGGYATVMKFDGTSWVYVGNRGFSGSFQSPSLTFAPDGVPYVVFQNLADGWKATVMKFDGTSWIYVGNGGFSAGEVQYPSLAFAPDGTPYVAYEDFYVTAPYSSSPSTRATVMKFDGTSWVNVGLPGFSAAQAQYTSLAFAQDGTPYVAYQDSGNSGKATVMKFDGTSWVNVGNAGFSASDTEYTSLAFSPDNIPYISYVDVGNNNKATVMKFDGSSWVNVGLPGFSGGVAVTTSLAFAPDGTPYVAYDGNDNSYYEFLPGAVMRFNGNSWTYVGNTNFLFGTAHSTSMAFAPNGTPYVVYSDPTNSNKATVMKFVDSPSVTTYPATNITGSGATLNGMVGNNGYTATVTFDYGTTASYGTTVVATTPSGGSIPASSGATATSVDLTGLSSTTAYHFRVNATVNGTTLYGSDASFTTDKATPTILWSNPADIVYGTPLSSIQLNAVATGDSGTLAGYFGYLPSSGTVLDAGNSQTLTVVFTPNDSTHYSIANKQVMINVLKALQTIAFAQPTSPVTYGANTPIALSATGGASGYPVTFSVASGPGTISGNTLTPIGAGVIVVSADEAGNNNYAAATTAQKSVVVNKASSSLTGPATAVVVISGQTGAIPVIVTGQYSGSGITAPSGLINYAIINSSNATVASGTVTITGGAVSVPVANTLAPGLYTVTTSYDGDNNYTAAALPSPSPCLK